MSDLSHKLEGIEEAHASQISGLEEELAELQLVSSNQKQLYLQEISDLRQALDDQKVSIQKSYDNSSKQQIAIDQLEKTVEVTRLQLDLEKKKTSALNQTPSMTPAQMRYYQDLEKKYV